MKKLLIVLTLLVASVVPAHADIAPSIAVIDTGTNTSLFKDNIVAEYCVIEFALCPNGKPTMEGAGAANLPPTKHTAFDHCSQMMSVVLKVAPTAKVIPIRILGMSANGSPTLYTNQSVKMALDWVLLNQAKYNIQVVNVSQGGIFAGCRVPAGTTEVVAALKAKGVAVVAVALIVTAASVALKLLFARTNVAFIDTAPTTFNVPEMLAVPTTDKLAVFIPANTKGLEDF
jgi:hypothetical protein